MQGVQRVPRWFMPLLVFAAAGLVLSVGTMIYMSSHKDGASGTPRVLQPDPLAVGLAVPDFALIDQNGRRSTSRCSRAM